MWKELFKKRQSYWVENPNPFQDTSPYAKGIDFQYCHWGVPPSISQMFGENTAWTLSPCEEKLSYTGVVQVHPSILQKILKGRVSIDISITILGTSLTSWTDQRQLWYREWILLNAGCHSFESCYMNMNKHFGSILNYFYKMMKIILLFKVFIHPFLSKITHYWGHFGLNKFLRSTFSNFFHLW